MRPLPFLCAAALLASSCSDSNTASGPPLTDVPGRYSSVYCAVFEDCFGPLASFVFAGADCETLAREGLRNGEATRWDAFIERGTVVYDGSKVDECLAALEGSGCDLLADRAPAVCDEVLEGTVAPGGNCDASVECEGERICQFTGSSCPGRCVERVAEGGGCDEDDECERGTACQDGQCRAPAAAGAACGGGSAPDCAANMVCAGESADTPGTCSAFDTVFRLGAGEPCDPEGGALCEVGLSCVLEGFSAGGLDFVCTAPSSSGGGCKPGFPDPCPSGEYCDTPMLDMGVLDGSCEPLPGDGEPCRLLREDEDDDAVRCAPSLVCVSNTCRTVKANGQGCGDDEECYSDNCASGTCAAPPLCAANDDGGF